MSNKNYKHVESKVRKYIADMKTIDEVARQRRRLEQMEYAHGTRDVREESNASKASNSRESGKKYSYEELLQKYNDAMDENKFLQQIVNTYQMVKITDATQISLINDSHFVKSSCSITNHLNPIQPSQPTWLIHFEGNTENYERGLPKGQTTNDSELARTEFSSICTNDFSSAHPSRINNNLNHVVPFRTPLVHFRDGTKDDSVRSNYSSVCTNDFSSAYQARINNNVSLVASSGIPLVSQEGNDEDRQTPKRKTFLYICRSTTKKVLQKFSCAEKDERRDNDCDNSFYMCPPTQMRRIHTPRMQKHFGRGINSMSTPRTNNPKMVKFSLKD